MVWQLYDLKKCCPDLSNECSKIAPLLNFMVFNPTDSDNDDGKVNIEFIGLNKTYYTIFKGIGTNEEGTTIISRSYENLKPGSYTLTVKPDKDSICSYTYFFTIGSFNTLQVRLKYANNNYVPLHPDSFSFLIPSNTSIYWNNDNTVDRQETGTTQCFLLEVVGGEPLIDIEYQDYLSYTSPDVYLTNGSPIDLDQSSISTDLERPPVVLNKVILNDTNSLSFCVNLAYNYGNGWIKIIVKDSSTIPQEYTIWLYVKQTIF